MKIKNFFLLFLFIFSINVGYANNKVLFTEISFEGLERVSQKLALSYITFHKNEFVSDRDIQNSIQKLYLSQKFKSIQCIQSDKKIIFKVQEFPILSKIFFQGNEKIDLGIMKNLLYTTKIFENQFFNKKKLEVLKKEILNYYSSILRNNVTVSFQILDKDKHTQDLKISILDQGPTYIHKLIFLNNNKFSTEEILNLFNFFPQKNFLKEKNSNYFSYENFKEGLEKLYHFYNSKGYLTFCVENTELKYSNNKKNVDIILKLNEGSQYFVSSINIHELNFPYVIKNSDVFSHLKVNKLYNIDDFFILQKNIQDILLRNGYLNANISIVPNIDKENKKVKFDINIDKKNLYRLNRIQIKGNDCIQEKDLLGIIHYKKNSILNMDLIKKDLEILQETNFFDQISFQFKPAHFKQSSVLDLTYFVHEKKANTFNLGFGYNSLKQLNYNFQFKNNHFFGMGKSFSIYLDKSFNRSNIEMCYQNPYFTTKKFFLIDKIFANVDEPNFMNNIHNNLYFSDYQFKNIYTNFMDFIKIYKLNFSKKILNYGVEQFFSIPIFSKFNLNTSIGYEYNESTSIFNNNIIEKNIILDQNVFKKIDFNQILYTEKNIYINNSICFNQLNDIYFPNSGNEFEFSIKSFFSIIDKNHFQLMYNSKQYFPIIKKNNLLTLFIHSYLNCEISLQDNLLFDNFTNSYNKNNNSIRGYVVNKIGPKILEEDTIFYNKINNFYLNNNLTPLIYKKDNFFNRTLGGNLVSVNSIELISSIPYIKNEYSKDVRISLFLDFGNIWRNSFFLNKDLNKNFVYFNPKNIYSSYGVSVKWKSPFGLISLSYAFPIGKHNYKDLENFQVRFGL